MATPFDRGSFSALSKSLLSILMSLMACLMTSLLALEWSMTTPMPHLRNLRLTALCRKVGLLLPRRRLVRGLLNIFISLINHENFETNLNR